MKTLLIDIETSPNTAHVWGLWNNDISISQLLESSYVMCWAAKWVGDKKVMFSSVFHEDHDTMIEKAYKLLDEADAVIHYNGTRFDMPTLNKEFLLKKMSPPAPYKNIDLLTTVKQQFRFPSNKLDYVAQRLGLGKKFQHEGHSLWVKCMNRDPKAWATMKKYNSQDVVLLEKVYYVLLPWIKGHPNPRVLGGKSHAEHTCPKCESEHVQKKGFAYTSTGQFQRYKCKDCGAWSRGEKTKAYKNTLKSI